LKRNFKITIEYDGTNFHGWQIQPSVRTIQGEIEKAVSIMTNSYVEVHGSGRTDAGVHALNQVANFTCNTKIVEKSFEKGLDHLVPKGIAIKECIEVPLDFHSRFSAKSKIYEYVILNQSQRPAIGRNYIWHIRQTLDIEKMKKAASYLIGKHDFKSFEAAGSLRAHSIRTIFNLDVKPFSNGKIKIIVSGDGFLRYMVRNITGTLVQIGLGKISPDEIPAILEKKDRASAGMTAPPHGLYLKEVIYD